MSFLSDLGRVVPCCAHQQCGKHTEGALEVLGRGVTEKDISDSLF